MVGDTVICDVKCNASFTKGMRARVTELDSEWYDNDGDEYEQFYIKLDIPIISHATECWLDDDEMDCITVFR